MNTETVSRTGFILGALVGIAIAGLGMTFIGDFGWPRLAELAAEMATMALALGATTLVWRFFSVSAEQVDAVSPADAGPASTAEGRTDATRG